MGTSYVVESLTNSKLVGVKVKDKNGKLVGSLIRRRECVGPVGCRRELYMWQVKDSCGIVRGECKSYEDSFRLLVRENKTLTKRGVGVVCTKIETKPGLGIVK